ncbi:hypothetical protein E5676_scaffold451G002040 [Cucumis melo var. makuwa]|uniref:Uncharacterized protein n=1 Tax=Cucumis melo var. makuwa TaxID=1194695 RepID=A0A5D3BQG0_CUCMM|nr:hypothetical protein E5676_scaffold451G002040 [Cucumis melo var. makuwa]
MLRQPPPAIAPSIVSISGRLKAIDFIEPSSKPVVLSSSVSRKQLEPIHLNSNRVSSTHARSNCSTPIILGIPLGITKDQLVPRLAQIARVRRRASSGTEAEVRRRASWRVTRSDRGRP